MKKMVGEHKNPFKRNTRLGGCIMYTERKKIAENMIKMQGIVKI